MLLPRTRGAERRWQAAPTCDVCDSQPAPSAAGPSACSFPRGAGRVTHEGPVLARWSQHTSGKGDIGTHGCPDGARALAKVGIREELQARVRATATASLRLCQREGRHWSVSASSLCHHLMPGWLRIHQLWAASVLMLGSFLALPSSHQAGATAGGSLPKGCVCSIEHWPDPALGRSRAERAQRGCAHGEEQEEGCVSQLSAHQSPK